MESHLTNLFFFQFFKKKCKKKRSYPPQGSVPWTLVYPNMFCFTSSPPSIYQRQTQKNVSITIKSFFFVFQAQGYR